LSALAERRFGVAVLALSVFAAFQGVAYAPFAGPRLGDSYGYIVAAKAIRHGSYSTPLPHVDVTGLRIPSDARGEIERQTYRTPGFPLLVAATGGGEHRAATRLLIGLQAVLAGLATLLIAFAARRLLPAGLALAAAAVVAADPYTKHYVPRVLSEALAIFLAAGVAYAFVRAWESRAPLWWGTLGAAVAVLTLTRPLFALLLPLALVAAAVRAARPWARAFAIAAVTTAAAVLLGPWLAWTHAATGRFVVSSFGEGWNLLIAAHGEGLNRTAVEIERDPAYVRDFTSVHRFAPSAAELRNYPKAHPHYLVRADSEQRRLAVRLYERRLRHHPASVAGEAAYRAYFLWMAHEDWVQPRGVNFLLRLADWIVFILALAGSVIAIRRGGALRGLAVALVVFTLVNAAHHVEARYAMPVRAVYLLLAVVGTQVLLGLRRSVRREERAG
jgi:4-amino-4-deoxy-L-arabinose transferase-like glycosyltransferase